MWDPDMMLRVNAENRVSSLTLGMTRCGRVGHGQTTTTHLLVGASATH
jgi:hypothetical protein